MDFGRQSADVIGRDGQPTIIVQPKTSVVLAAEITSPTSKGQRVHAETGRNHISDIECVMKQLQVKVPTTRLTLS